MVNTSNAGPGALGVTIDGPSKVKMDCVECPEGYRITYTPMAPGNYLISIKYGGPYHIVGSPFKAKITGLDQNQLQAPGSLKAALETEEKVLYWYIWSFNSRFQTGVQP